jgi:NAD(P)-dependent dehydrogenase (short-subunit alcohol dehydrogenase family)
MAKEWTLKTLEGEKLMRLNPGALFSLEDRVAIVTGAGGGLGAWLSADLGAAGARVLLTDHPRSSTQQTASVMRETGATVVEYSCDLLDSDAGGRIVQAAVAEFGRVDVVVNNAGTNKREPIFEVSRQSSDIISTVDLRLPYELSRAAARVIVEHGQGGSIIHIGSLNNAIGLEGVSVYGAHKAGGSRELRGRSLAWNDPLVSTFLYHIRHLRATPPPSHVIRAVNRLFTAYSITAQ